MIGRCSLDFVKRTISRGTVLTEDTHPIEAGYHHRMRSGTALSRCACVSLHATKPIVQLSAMSYMARDPLGPKSITTFVCAVVGSRWGTSRRNHHSEDCDDTAHPLASLFVKLLPKTHPLHPPDLCRRGTECQGRWWLLEWSSPWWMVSQLQLWYLEPGYCCPR